MRRAGGGFRVSSYPPDEWEPVVSPQGVEELRPWFMAVVRARGRGVTIFAWNPIARLMQSGVDWDWTLAHILEQVEIINACGIELLLSIGEVFSRADSNEEQSGDLGSLQQQ